MADSGYYSINDFPGDGSQTTFEVSFAGGYISRSHISARLFRDIDGTFTDVLFDWINAYTIRVATPVPVGYTLRMYRSTPIREPLVDYSDGALLSEINLDTANKQAIFAAAEAADAFGTVPGNDALRDATAALVFARSRANHTGTQAMSTVTGLSAALAALVSSTFLASGTAASAIGMLNYGTGAVVRVLQAKLAEMPSVADFGAKGDGVTDDTAALQKALDYIGQTVRMDEHSSNSPAAGAQNLFWPAGLYRVTDTLIISRSSSFYGDGHSEYSSGTRIQIDTPNKDLFRVAGIAQGVSVSFTDLTLRANGGGGTGGALINFSKPAIGGQCNSVRIIGCTFGTPQSTAIRLQSGDDYVIHKCLFDVSATNNIELGSAAGGFVTNVRITECDFFDIALKCIVLWSNVVNLVVSGNTFWSSTNTTACVIDAFDAAPVGIKNISITNNVFKGIRCLIRITGAANIVIMGNSGSELGEGSISTKSWIELIGANTNVVIISNAFTGQFGGKNFVSDLSNGGNTGIVIEGNAFRSQASVGDPFSLSVSQCRIGVNSLIGFVKRSVGQRWTTTGNSVVVTPSTVTRTAPGYVMFEVMGAQQGDDVKLSSGSLDWLAPVGFIVNAYVSAPNVVTLQYVNVSAPDPTGVPQRDVSVTVTR